MMGSTRILTCVAVATLMTSTPALAQQRGTVGLGVGISSSLTGDLTSLLTPTLYLPITAGPRLIVEPGIGLIRVRDGDQTETLLAAQAGILFVVSGGNDDRIYVGPRIGILRSSFSVDNTAIEDSETNITLAGVAGGEFFLRALFSLGGEVGVEYLDIDDGSLLSTTAEFRVRWYFGQ